MLYVFCSSLSAAPWSSQFTSLGQVCLFLLVGSVFLSTPTVFRELKGGGSKSSFQMHRKTRERLAYGNFEQVGCAGLLQQLLCGVA